MKCFNVVVTVATLLLFEVRCDPTEVKSLKISTLIQSRFATTHVSTVVTNEANYSRESLFHVYLPEEAYITNFTMEINGEFFYGLVKESEKAQNAYQLAKEQRMTAGLIAASPRETNLFTVAINLEPQSKATFNLTYQELLKRIQGFYKHVVTIDPKQVVEDLHIETIIVERAELATLRSPKVESRLDAMSNADLSTLPDSPDVVVTADVDTHLSTAQIYYRPDSATQQRLITKGLPSQLITLYDIKSDSSEIEIEAVNGYFVQFFSPKGLSVGSKQIVFVLDKSGSMQGAKLAQMKEAMRAILNDLRPTDSFNIVIFSGLIRTWQNSSVLADPANIRAAVELIDSLIAAGGTNLQAAMTAGLSAFNPTVQSSAKIILFLTDGRPTNGVRDEQSLLEAVRQINSTAHINCVAFGNDADYEFLKKLAAQNGGLARKIYVDSDAVIQLKGFYDEIGSPLLSNIRVKYLDESNIATDTIVLSDSQLFHDTGELIVVGQLKSLIDFTKEATEKNRLIATVTGSGANGTEQFHINQTICDCINGTKRGRRTKLPKAVEHKIAAVNSVGGFVERMWAYLTIKKLLVQANYKEENPIIKEELKRKALELSIKYNFVTEVTSMVVVKSNPFATRPTDDFIKPTGQRSRPLLIVKPIVHKHRTNRPLSLFNNNLQRRSGSCYRTRPARLSDFDMSYFKRFKGVRTADRCAFLCFKEAECKFVIFTPRMECIWTDHYRLPSCDLTSESVGANQPVILYCITCVSQ